mgnify:FL=1
MLKAGKDRAMILEMKEKIHENLSMKELENARHILRLRIERNRIREILQVSQSDYVRKVLRIFNMENSKPVRTPLVTSTWRTDMDSPSSKAMRDKWGGYHMDQQ